MTIVHTFVSPVLAERHLTTLPGLLSADQSNNPAQLSALGKLLLLDLFGDVLVLGELAAQLQHAVLQGQHLGQGVVEEGGGERDAVGRRVLQADLELARLLLAVDGALLLYRRRGSAVSLHTRSATCLFMEWMKAG